jgi:hypothetical protein
MQTFTLHHGLLREVIGEKLDSGDFEPVELNTTEGAKAVLISRSEFDFLTTYRQMLEQPGLIGEIVRDIEGFQADPDDGHFAGSEALRREHIGREHTE